MAWAVTLMTFCEVAKEDAASASKRAERQAERKRESERDGDILAVSQNDTVATTPDVKTESSFSRLWGRNRKWATLALNDAVEYAKENTPRAINPRNHHAEEIAKVFYGSLWDSLKGRGWKEEEIDGGKVFKYDKYMVSKSSPAVHFPDDL